MKFNESIFFDATCPLTSLGAVAATGPSCGGGAGHTRNNMAGLYGYPEIYRPHIEMLRTLDRSMLNAIKEAAASDCGVCPTGGRFPEMIQGLIDEKRRSAA